jgi:hypothetical protein
MSASDLLSITKSSREKLNLHHETDILKELSNDCAFSNKSKDPLSLPLPLHLPLPLPLPLRLHKEGTRETRETREARGSKDQKLINPKNNNSKINHYQILSDNLATWIFLNSKEKIIAATIKGHGWTNIFQYLPTNHPSGIAQIMPILSSNKSHVWAAIPKATQEHILKYFAGVDNFGIPIPSTKENDGVPLILLIQGPKIGATRSLDCLRTQGLNPVMDQLVSKFGDLYPGVKLVHRWVGKNGYIIEAVWDQEGYQFRLDLSNKALVL